MFQHHYLEERIHKKIQPCDKIIDMDYKKKIQPTRFNYPLFWITSLSNLQMRCGQIWLTRHGLYGDAGMKTYRGKASTFERFSAILNSVNTETRIVVAANKMKGVQVCDSRKFSL